MMASLCPLLGSTSSNSIKLAQGPSFRQAERLSIIVRFRLTSVLQKILSYQITPPALPSISNLAMAERLPRVPHSVLV